MGLLTTLAGTPVQGFDILVDSVSGNDANDGLTADSAFATLGAAETAALSYGPGVRIGLARGSRWRATLNLQTLDGVTISAYGSGDPPEVSCGDIFAGPWDDSTARADAHTNVYSVDWAHEAGNSEAISVLEDGVRLREIWTSVADCQSTAGSYYAPIASESDTTTTVYIHPTGSTDPASNGSSYELAKRIRGVWVGENCTLFGLAARLNLANDGSFEMQDGSSLVRSLAKFGTKHSVVAQGNSIYLDSILRESHQNTSSGATTFLVDYDDTMAGRTMRADRCGFVWGRTLAQTSAVSPYTSHAADASNLAIVTVKACWTIGLYTAFPGDRHNQVITEDCYSVSNTAPTFGNATTAVLRRHLHHNDSAVVAAVQPSDLATDSAIEHCAFRNTVSSGFEIYEHRAGANVIVIRNCAYVTTQARPFARDSGINGGSQDFSLNVMYGSPGGLNGYTVSASGQAFTSDHNIYYYPGSNQLRARYGGTSYTTLSGWQAATGQDANSVYLTDAQAATFWLNDPADGDFRINPAASVTGADGTIYAGEFPDGTPITDAGPQEHYDWNSRSVVAGPPEVWPTVPESEADCISYIGVPGNWDFYPA